jgi:hypothetical protein
MAGWKGFLPVGEDVPCRPFKGRVSKDTRQRLRMALSPEKSAGYPDVLGPHLLRTHQSLAEKKANPKARMAPSQALLGRG